MSVKFTGIKTFFVENRIMKLLALLLAIMTVFAIQSITNQMDKFEIPIVVKVDEGVAVLKQDAKTAYITCRGSMEDLRRLDVRQLKVVVSPKNTGVAGGERVPIGPRNVEGWSRGVQIIKVIPEIIAVEFDRAIEKQVGVGKPETVGEPLLGKAEIDYEPKIVTIRGPKSKLGDRKILRTEPIDVTGAVDAFTKRVKILSEGESGVWEVEPSEVTVHVSIVTEAISKEWNDIEVMAMVANDCGRSFTFSPPSVVVSLLGSPQAINRIQPKDLSVFVDCTGLVTTGVHTIPAFIHLPPGINLSAALEPPMLEVTVVRNLPEINNNAPQQPENTQQVSRATAPETTAKED